MFTLQLLGGLALSGPDGPVAGRANQPRRLALLALLALAPRKAASRDRLMAMLWPECGTREARRNLSSALYDLRQALGEQALVSVNGSIGLDPAVVSSDVARFEAAVAAGRWDDAVTCYAGPLLDGLYPVGDGEFEPWIETERQRLARLYQRALDGLAEAAPPFQPSAAATIPESIEPMSPARRRRIGLVVAGGVLILGISLGGYLSFARPGSPAPPVRLAVLPFRGFGNVEAGRVGQSVVDLLTRVLDGAGELRTIDPAVILAGLEEQSSPASARSRARRLGATHYIVGSADAEPGRLRLAASLYPIGARNPEAQASVEGDPDHLIALVDRLGAALLAERLDPVKDRIARIGAVSTTSLPALKAWLSGEAAFRRGAYREAADAFEQATALDTSFALAHYRYSLATLWGDRPGASTDSHDAAAERHAGRLAPRDRRLLEAYIAWRQGDPALAEYRYRRILDLWPDDLEAWHQLGETFFHYNPLRGRAIAEARAPFERALALDPEHRGARWHLTLLDAREGRTESFRQGLIRLADSSSTGAGSGTESRGLLLATRRSNDPVRGDPVWQSIDETALSSVAWRLAVFVGDLDAAEKVARHLTGPGRNGYAVSVGRRILAQLAMARGQFRVALTEYSRAPAIGAGFDAPLGQGQLLTHWWLTAPRQLAAPLRDSLENLAGLEESAVQSRSYTAGLLSLILGDSAPLNRAALRLRRPAGGGLAQDLALALRAGVHARAGRPRQVLAALDSMGPPGWFGHLVTGAPRGDPLLRFLRAEALLALGRDGEATPWLNTFAEHAMQDLAYLAPAHFRLGQILERQGRTEEARAHFARVASLWAGADPEFQPWVAAARTRLNGKLAQTPSPPQQARMASR